MKAYALTIIQPWATLIVEGPKGIENRSWSPPLWIRGQRIYIHAGKKTDLAGADKAMEEGIWEETAQWKTWPVRGAIIGSAIVSGVIHESDDPWFVPGQVGWKLTDRRVCEPVPCKGAQGLWVVPPDVLAKLEGRAA